MTKAKLFWFSKIGTKDSFSRIAESLLPLLTSQYKLYTIVPPDLTFDSIKLFTNVLRMGSNINGGGLRLDEEQFMLTKGLNSKMKFILLQVLAHCQEHKIETLLITMGVYEADWFMNIINQIKSTSSKFLLNGIRVMCYVPFDYVPNYDAVKNLITCDKLITTMPFMIEKLSLLTDNVDWVGHGISTNFKKLVVAREMLIKLINSLNIKTGPYIEMDDLIILNANLYGSRKRIDITIKAFEYLLTKTSKNCKLWLHGTTQEELRSLVISEETLKYIVTSSKIKDSELNLLYNIAKIGLQTSWGEGWSLTNCEHALLGGLQIVPRWLACEYHFSDNRGILCDIKTEYIKNEAGIDVLIGVPVQESVNESLLNAVENIDKYDPAKTIEYMEKYTWQSCANRFDEIISKAF